MAKNPTATHTEKIDAVAYTCCDVMVFRFALVFLFFSGVSFAYFFLFWQVSFMADFLLASVQWRVSIRGLDVAPPPSFPSPVK